MWAKKLASKPPKSLKFLLRTKKHAPEAQNISLSWYWFLSISVVLNILPLQYGYPNLSINPPAAPEYSNFSGFFSSKILGWIIVIEGLFLKISRLQDAVSKKDSVTLAIVSSLKKSVGIDDPDIEINVEKGVVFISIADKLLFKSGSYVVTEKAKVVLGKVAKVINDKPEFEAMIEGHTDSRSYSNGVLIDNWDLSVKRSTSIIRELQTMGVNPSQLIAAGRSSYVPLVDNETAENRARNRRTRVVVMPKIDQFYEMIEKEMKELSLE